jgi:iron-sulfur cluster repair protein YtfE (RIC family)
MTISSYMATHHAFCDELFTNVENLAAQSDWQRLRSVFNEFTAETERHFLREETILFPRLENVMGSADGPTQVMRLEHEQIRLLTGNLKVMIENEDRNGILGEADTLLIMMQQHNAKEEQILYPMMDRILVSEEGSLLVELEAC